MAKKNKNSTLEPKLGFVTNRDVHNRLNFLYQASTLLSITLNNPKPPGVAKNNDKGKGVENPSHLHNNFLISTQAGPITSAEDENQMKLDVDAISEEKEMKSHCSTSKLPCLPLPIPFTAASPFRSEIIVTLETGVGIEASFTSKREELQSKREELKLLKRKRPSKDKSALGEVSRMMTGTMKDIAKKSTIRMDPSVKRTLCKKCNSRLIPGLTSRIRIKPSKVHAHLILHTCNNCQTILRLPAPPHLPEAPELIRAADTMEGVEDVVVEEKVIEARKLTKREKSELKKRKRPVHFERGDHITDTKGL